MRSASARSRRAASASPARSRQAAQADAVGSRRRPQRRGPVEQAQRLDGLAAGVLAGQGPGGRLGQDQEHQVAAGGDLLSLLARRTRRGSGPSTRPRRRRRSRTRPGAARAEVAGLVRSADRVEADRSGVLEHGLVAELLEADQAVLVGGAVVAIVEAAAGLVEGGRDAVAEVLEPRLGLERGLEPSQGHPRLLQLAPSDLILSLQEPVEGRRGGARRPVLSSWAACWRRPRCGARRPRPGRSTRPGRGRRAWRPPDGVGTTSSRAPRRESAGPGSACRRGTGPGPRPGPGPRRTASGVPWPGTSGRSSPGRAGSSAGACEGGTGSWSTTIMRVSAQVVPWIGGRPVSMA